MCNENIVYQKGENMFRKINPKKIIKLFLISIVTFSLLLQGKPSAAMAAGESTTVTTASIINPSLKVQMYNVDRTDSTGALTPSFRLINAGTTPANLQDIKIRYYFTGNGSNVLSYHLASSSPSISNSILGNFVKISKGVSDADYYFEAGFDELAGTLAAGGNVDFGVSIHKNIDGNFTQMDDYSFNQGASEFVDWSKVTAYYGGSLVWGEEISIFTPPSENYALNQTVTASSAISSSDAGWSEGWALNHVTDGERRSIDGSNIGWSSSAGDSQWIKVDLGALQTINRVDLYAINWLSSNRGRNGIVGEGYPVDFTIQVSEDDSHWTTVSTLTDVLRPTLPCNSYWFDSVAARYVKIESTENRQVPSASIHRMALSEIEVYHDSSYAPPPSPPTVPSEGRAVIAPAEFTGAIQNPLMGMAEKDFRVNLLHEWPLDYNPWASLAMTYIPWDYLEDDVSDTIDEIAQYSNERWRGQDTNGNWISYEDYNMKVIPRVYLKFPPDISYGLEGNHWPADMTANDFTSDQFDSRLKRLIQRLGALWDNDPRVAYIQMGIYGTWGEQHGTGVPANVDAYFHQYFPNKKVEVRYETGHEEFSFGQYNDSIANMKTISNWKKQEVGGETAYDYNGADLLGSNPHLTMLNHANNAANMIRNVHAIYLTWIGEYTYRIDPGYPGLPAYYDNKEQLDAGAETIQKAFGYRYVVTDFNYPRQVDPGQDFVVQFKVKNTGASPMYYNWPVQLSLRDPDTNEIVWSDTFKNVDIRDWLPGEGYTAWNKSQTGNWSQSVLDYTTPPNEYIVADTFTLPPNLVANKNYMIQLAVLDPAGNVPSLRFAIQNYKQGGYSPMGYMGVSQDPGTIAIDSSYFDSPAKDISLRYYSADSISQSEPPQLTAVTVSGPTPVVNVGGSGFNLSHLPITAEDQYGYAHNVMVGIPVTWSIVSGEAYASLSGSNLTPVSPGIGRATAAMDGVTSNEVRFYVNAASNSGVIEGTIKDSSGNGVQGAAVSLDAGGSNYSAETDAAGSYYIMDVPAGTGYKVTASKNGFQDTAALGVAVSAGTAASVDLALSPFASGKGTIAGSVKDSAGNGIEGANVSIAAGGNAYAAITDATGNYSIVQVPAGSGYTVAASKTGYHGGAAAEVTVTEGRISTANITITATEGTIAGTIKDNLGHVLQGVNVSVAVNGIDYIGVTDAAGKYSIVNVPEGTGYTLTAAKNGYQKGTSSGVEVTGASTTTVNLTVMVIPAGDFSDDFSGGSGNWAPGTGTWSVSNGEYIQSAGSNSNAWKYSTAIKDKVWYDATYEVDLKSDNGSSWASFMFRKINQSDSANNTGYFVYFTGTGDVQLSKAGSAVTTLKKVTGAMTGMTDYHHLKIVTKGNNIKVYVDDQTAPIIDVNDSSYTAGYAGLGNGGAKWYYDNVRVTPGISTGSVAGNVTDDLGNPLDGVTVGFTVGGSSYSAATDADGSYTIVNVPAGAGYTVTASKAGYLDGTAAGVAVTEGEVSTVNFTLSAIPSVPPAVPVLLSGPQSVTGNQVFDVILGLNTVSQSVYAQDFTFNYDPLKVEYMSAESLKPGFSILDSSAASGQIRFIAVDLQAGQAAASPVNLLKAQFKAKALEQNATSSVYLSNVILADGAGLETTVTDAVYYSFEITAAVVKSALSEAIANAQSLHDSAVEGTLSGQYPAGSKAGLLASIQHAVEVLNNGAATQMQVDQALHQLSTAVQLFQSLVIPQVRGDLNGDGRLGLGDLALMAASYYGSTSSDADWDTYKKADLNNDNLIDIEDLYALARLILGQSE